MKKYMKLAAAAALGASAMALTTLDASASVVCNAAGECWHVRHPYAYPVGVGVVVHPDGWRWGPADHFVWREHPGRGYWRNGVWIRL